MLDEPVPDHGVSAAPSWPGCASTSGEIYLDSWALVKLVQREDETDALRRGRPRDPT